MKKFFKFVKHNPLFFGPFIFFVFLIVIGIVADSVVASISGAVLLTLLMIFSFRAANGKMK